VDGPATGVDQQSEQVGGAAVDLVVNQINNNESGIPMAPKAVLLPGVWVGGSTTLKLKTASATRRKRTRASAKSRAK